MRCGDAAHGEQIQQVNRGVNMKNIEVPASDIPRTIALCGGDREAVSQQVGAAALLLDVLLVTVGVDAKEIDDEKYARATALLLETLSEQTFTLVQKLGGAKGEGDAVRADH